jgi:hypothetical protein
MYVDDVVLGADDEDSGMKLHEESKRILQEGGFNLWKFTTNAPQLQNAIDRKENPVPHARFVLAIWMKRMPSHLRE